MKASSSAHQLPHSFTTEALKCFFQHIEKHYECFPLRDWRDGRHGIILRQDVDLDLGQARAFADIQAEIGLSSTFYVLLTSNCYNAQSPESIAIMRSLVCDGFEVGLHFDPTVNEDPNRYKREAELLETLCGSPVESISLHNPTSRGEFPLYPHFLNAYDPRIFGPDRYLSDSRLRWQQDPWTFVKKASTQCLQLLFHPCHYSPSGHGYDDAFLAYMIRHCNLVDAAFRKYNDNYAKTVSPHLNDWYPRTVLQCTPARTKTEDPE